MNILGMELWYTSSYFNLISFIYRFTPRSGNGKIRYIFMEHPPHEPETRIAITATLWYKWQMQVPQQLLFKCRGLDTVRRTLIFTSSIVHTQRQINDQNTCPKAETSLENHESVTCLYRVEIARFDFCEKLPSFRPSPGPYVTWPGKHFLLLPRQAFTMAFVGEYRSTAITF